MRQTLKKAIFGMVLVPEYAQRRLMLVRKPPMLFTTSRLHTEVISFEQAAAYVTAYHRHNRAPVGHIFSIGCYYDGVLVGVAMCGRPVARSLDKDRTLEVYRVCTRGQADACTKLYGACQQLARARGYAKLITYTRQSETAGTVRGANFVLAKAHAGGARWSGQRQRRRRSGHTNQEPKQRWEFDLQPGPLFVQPGRDGSQVLVHESNRPGAPFDYIIYPGQSYVRWAGLPAPAYDPPQLGSRACPTSEQFADLHALAYLADQAGFQLILARLNPGFPVYLTTCRRGGKHRESIQWCDTHLRGGERIRIYLEGILERRQRDAAVATLLHQALAA